jgi:hypothetical protein
VTWHVLHRDERIEKDVITVNRGGQGMDRAKNIFITRQYRTGCGTDCIQSVF